jgi:hypothetical protein
MFEFIRNYVKTGLKIIFAILKCAHNMTKDLANSTFLKRSLSVRHVNLTILEKFTLFLDN